MEDLELLSPNRCYIEFGAGKGKLSHWIHIALKEAKNVHFLLVERSSTRFKVWRHSPEDILSSHQVQEKVLFFLLESKVQFQFYVFKVDGKHKNADSTFDRLQVDIQHLDLRELAF